MGSWMLPEVDAANEDYQKSKGLMLATSKRTRRRFSTRSIIIAPPITASSFICPRTFESSCDTSIRSTSSDFWTSCNLLRPVFCDPTMLSRRSIRTKAKLERFWIFWMSAHISSILLSIRKSIDLMKHSETFALDNCRFLRPLGGDVFLSYGEGNIVAIAIPQRFRPFALERARL